MAEKPNARELLEAVQKFLERDLLPELEGVRRFHARVAVNVLGIVQRELALEGEQWPAQHARLSALLGKSEPAPAGRDALLRAIEELERELSSRIRSGFGDAPDERERLLAHLRATAAERLAVSNPNWS